MARKKLFREERRTIRIPGELAAEIDLRLWDPVRNKPKYGAFNNLVIQLLNEYLAEEKSRHAKN